MKYKHEWDLVSGFCIYCGINRELQVETPRDCYREKKIIAISHTRAKARTKELILKAREPRNEKE